MPITIKGNVKEPKRRLSKAAKAAARKRTRDSVISESTAASAATVERANRRAQREANAAEQGQEEEDGLTSGGETIETPDGSPNRTTRNNKSKRIRVEVLSAAGSVARPGAPSRERARGVSLAGERNGTLVQPSSRNGGLVSELPHSS